VISLTNNTGDFFCVHKTIIIDYILLVT